jgi:ABC-type multidrug transport system ATPase subunit
MGPSGAGKTTLLDVMSGRKNAGEISGRVFIGDVPVSKKLLMNVAAYVEQNDALLGTLTVGAGGWQHV